MVGRCNQVQNQLGGHDKNHYYGTCPCPQIEGHILQN